MATTEDAPPPAPEDVPAGGCRRYDRGGTEGRPLELGGRADAKGRGEGERRDVETAAAGRPQNPVDSCRGSDGSG